MWLILPILTGLLIVICLFMILTILMQRPKSEGLGAAFGGGLTDNLFGAQTTTVLKAPAADTKPATPSSAGK